MITKNRILFAIGAWMVLVPLLGFPSAYETFFMIASGLIVVVLAFLYARDKRFFEMHGDVRGHNPHPHFPKHDSSPESAHDDLTPRVYEESRPAVHQFQKSPEQFQPQRQPEQTTSERYTDLKSILSRSKNF